MDTLGKRVNKIRALIKLSQKEFANKLGIDRSHISHIECGRADPSDQLINLICRTFEINGEWLRDGKEPMMSNPELPLKETIELKEKLKEIGKNGLLTRLDFYTRNLDILIKNFSELKLIDIDLDNPDPELLIAKENMERALDYLKYKFDLLFKMKKKT